MMRITFKIIILLFIGFFLQDTVFGQISVSPEKPGFTEEVTLTFRADEGNQGLKDYNGDLYVHTGLITDQSAHGGDWKYVVADWGQNRDQLKMSATGDNTWVLKFKISELYGIPPAGNVTALAFVFRSADGSKVGKSKGDNDIYYYLKEPKFTAIPEVLPKSETAEPDWSRSANIYEVNIRQYTPEGTINEFSEHLPRLREMGVNILWFMPIQPIGVKNRKGSLGSYYSIQDYTDVNPEFGTMEDFKKLVSRAHGMGFRVVLDWVANHSAWDHQWIDQHPDWYARDKDGAIIAPYDWTDVAKLNYNQHYLREAMAEAMAFWVREADIDGFRCDVAGEVPLDFWEPVRKRLEQIRPVWMIAEDADKTYLMNRAFNANYGWTFHHLMNEIAKGIVPASAVFEDIERQQKSYPEGSYAMQFITNHDENSWSGTEYERLGNGTSAFSVLYYTVPGMPLIYSGQEAATKKRLLFFEKDPIDWSNKTLAPFYTRLNALKSEHQALWNGKHGGELRKINNDKADAVVAFSRTHPLSKVVVIINLSDKTQEVSLDAFDERGSYKEYFTGKSITLYPATKMKLEPWGYRVLIPVAGATGSIRSFQSMQKIENGLKINTNNGIYHLKSITSDAVEVVFEPEGHINPPSYAVSSSGIKVPTRTKETSTHIEYISGAMTINIRKSPFKISYQYQSRPLTKEYDGYFECNDYYGFSFELGADEVITGGGERVLGMNRKGKKLRLYNKPSFGYESYSDLMYYSMPVIISSRKYMIIFDNASDGYLDIGATDPSILSFEGTGGRMSYIVVASNDWKSLATNYTAVTGRQPLPPKWTMGNIASRMGYHSQQEVETLVSLYQKYDIPLDAVVLDLYWFGKELKGTLGNLEWYRDSFPTAEKMMAELRSKGIKTVLITEPFIIQNTLKYDEVVKNGLLATRSDGSPYLYDFYFGRTGLLDIFKESTRKWFWDIYRRHTLSGVSGWWGDLGEPEVHPDDIVHVNGRGQQVHNIYGHEWASLIFNGYKKDFPDQRPVILMRSGFAGSQRYGMIPWSGDVNRSWGGLKPQVEIGLTMGMQGLGYMHSDLGGFAGDYRDEELYARWLQYGAFQPVYRTHAQESVPAEPVFWDKKTRDIVSAYIRLRYDMLPYNYTLAWQNNTTGIPMMRPLVYMEDRMDHLNNTTTYLWGDDFLVSPVTEKGAKTQKVTFPAGNKWIDFHTGKKLNGGTEAIVPVVPEHIPVYVRAGAIIPYTGNIRHTEDIKNAQFRLEYYHDSSVQNSTGYLYDDDGMTPDAYEKGAYRLTTFKLTHHKKKITLSATVKGNGFEGEKKPENFRLNIIEDGTLECEKITVRYPDGSVEDLTTALNNQPTKANVWGKKKIKISLPLKTLPSSVEFILK
jgi:oligosaccharide 4-alpha-D-glucosyltransferase